MMHSIRCVISQLIARSVLVSFWNQWLVHRVVVSLPNNLGFNESLKIFSLQLHYILDNSWEYISILINKTLLLRDLKWCLLDQNSHWLKMVNQLLSEPHNRFTLILVFPDSGRPVQQYGLLRLFIQEDHDFVLEIKVDWDILRRKHPFE